MVEKPKIKIEIIAGIYIAKPEILNIIPKDTYFGMDNLIKKLINNNIPIVRYFTKDYWLDIGRIEDYNEVQDIYNSHFK